MHANARQGSFFQPKSFIASIILTIMGICSLSLANQSLGATVSGTVSLPNGETAQNDVQLWVKAYPTQSSSASSQQVSVTINPGDSSASYSLDILDNASWIIAYQYPGHDYVMEGYYAGNNGTTWTKDEAVTLPGSSNYTGIGLTLLAGHTVSGQVSLPAGFAPPETPITVVMEANVVIPNRRDNNVSVYFVTLSKDNPQGQYHLKVPDTMGYPFNINYFILVFKPCRSFLSIGYYATSSTTPDPENATLLASGRDWDNIDLVLIHRSPWNLFLPAILNSARRSRK